MFSSREKHYDRESCLEAAAKAQARGRLRKAVGHYMKALDVDPEDHFVHAKVAPLLARMKKFEEAWESFRIAASKHFASGFSNKAIGIYSQAARFMPRNPEVWEAMAYVYVQQGRKADAVATLYKGHGFFTHGPDRHRAVVMLRKAFALEPWNFGVTFDLAKLMKKQDPVEALGLLEGLSSRSTGADLRKVRSAMFCAEPSVTMAWEWLKTAWTTQPFRAA
jgi:tetratricopeptide (TPR) repeat protein